MDVMWVSHSYAADRDTRELGEAYQELRKVDRAYRLLERRLARIEPRVHGRAARLVHELAEALAEVRHDASMGAIVDMARDAFGEAIVRRVVRK